MFFGEISIVLSLAKKFVLGVVDNSPRLRTIRRVGLFAARDTEDSDEKYAGACRWLPVGQSFDAEAVRGASRMLDCHDSPVRPCREALRSYSSLAAIASGFFPALILRATRSLPHFSIKR